MKDIKDYDQTFSSQLMKFLNSNIKKKMIGGIFSKNDMEKISKNKFYILNTDVSTGHGIHWCAIYNDSNNNVLFYDSFNRDSEELFPEYTKKYNFVNYKIPFEYTQKKVQENCGSYVLAWIIYILHNIIENV